MTGWYRHFHRDAIFMDVDDIPAGVDFVDAITEAVGRCDLLLAVIGDNWVDLMRQERAEHKGERDWASVEIAAALKKNIRVIPVLVQGADMPAADALSEELVALRRRNALRVEHRSFESDMERLVDSVRDAVPAKLRSRVVGRENDVRNDGAEKAKGAGAIGTVSVVFGALSLLALWESQFLGITGGLAAAVCGHIGVSRSKRPGARQGRRRSITGLVLGYAAIVVSVILALLIVVVESGM